MCNEYLIVFSNNPRVQLPKESMACYERLGAKE